MFVHGPAGVGAKHDVKALEEFGTTTGLFIPAVGWSLRRSEAGVAGSP